MEVLILAGGKGERLRPLTNGIPKPMVNIIDKPIIGVILERLKAAGLNDVVITLGYLGSVISDYVGDGKKFGLNVKYLSEREPLGTAGAVKNARNYLGDNFLVVSGDAYFELDFEKFIDFHFSKDSLCTISTTYVDDVTGFGVVNMSDEGKITGFVEKPSIIGGGIVNTGIYLMKKEILNLIPDGFYDFGKNLFPRLIGKMFAFKSNGYWSDIGTLERYYLTNLHCVKEYQMIERV